MLLGDYYDTIVKEAGLTNEIGEFKTAEAIEAFKNEGIEFETEKEASVAIEGLIEDDYAEKVASVLNEFDQDKIEFEGHEQKVAAAMEIIDGFEKVSLADIQKESEGEKKESKYHGKMMGKYPMKKDKYSDKEYMDKYKDMKKKSGLLSIVNG